MRLLWLAPLCTGCIAGALPPSQSELGGTVVARQGESLTGVRFSTGAHLASATLSHAVPFDVGVGYVVERLEHEPAHAPPLARTIEPAPEASPVLLSHGPYLEASHRVTGSASGRSWLGLRSELLFDASERTSPEVLIAARLGWEAYATGQGGGGFSDRCGGGAGVASGTIAVGGYLESGYRVSSTGEAAFVATGGVALRLPFLAGFAINTCR